MMHRKHINRSKAVLGGAGKTYFCSIFDIAGNRRMSSLKVSSQVVFFFQFESYQKLFEKIYVKTLSVVFWFFFFKHRLKKKSI